MAVIKKTLFAKNLDRFAVLVNDTQSDSKYFKITELSDTLTGGKNAFLIAGSEHLVPDTKIQIELKDSAGNVIYHEPGEGYFSSSLDGEGFITEYYEGVSKVVAVYVYPDTAYGPCTLTILGELNEYEDGNGITTPVPLDWENKYNVKWQKQIDVNPSLANTTKIRFYKRPTVTITELLDPIYRIDSTTGVKINTGINQSFASIKVSNLETFAGDVKRVKVFRTSLGDISDYDLIQDILVESKELLTTFGLSGSVVGNTGIFTSETLKNYWITGSLTSYLTSSRVESGVALNGSGYFTHSASLDIRNTNTYELNLDAFYSSSTDSNLGIYLSQVTTSTDGITPLIVSSSIATLIGTQPTKNLLDTVIPFKIDRNYPEAKLYFSQSQGEWHLGNISLRLSQDTAFSPDEISFITTMPTVVGNEDFNFKFEFYDVNNNYVPVLVTGSANFTGGSNAITKLLTFESDRTAFRFSSGSVGNPPFQQVRFKTQKTNFTGSITYSSSSFDINGNYIEPTSYAGAYPGALTNQSDVGALLTIASFSGSVGSVLVGSITYTASCEGVEEYETIYRFEDGDNAPGVFVTANTNQFIYKATDLSLNPVGQIITIEAKRKNLASAITPLTVNSGSGKPPLTFVSTNATNGVDTYTLAGTTYPYVTGETIYYISGSDQFGNEFSDSIKITPVKILDGLSATLTNDNASLPALSNGFVASGSFLFTSGSVNVKVGNETIAFDDDNDSSRANNTFAITNVSGLGCTPNGGNNSNPSENSYSITDLSADSGSLDITIDYKDGAGDSTSLIKTITYTKNKKAAPVLKIEITNNAQSVTAKSTGVQIGTFSDSVVTVSETYNGVTTIKPITTLTAASSNISSIVTTPLTGTITLNGRTLTDGTDNTIVSITATIIDSEGTSRDVTDSISLSKIKNAAPITLALLSSETQTILSSSIGYATPSTFTVNVTEGSSNYTFDSGLTNINTYYISSISGGSNSSGNVTPTTPTTNSGITTSITISYKNSEGSTGTITKTHNVAVSLEGTKGTDGNTGADGKRTATGMIHYQIVASSAPPTPSATSFTFSNGTFSGLTANWGTGAPTYASGNTNKYWYATYTVVETTAGGGTGTPTFGTPSQAIGFSGLVSFTSANAIDNGLGNSLSFGVTGATLINGSNISTGKIISTNYQAGTPFTTAGSIIDLDNGRISTKTFYVDANGDAVFKGTLSAAGGTFAGQITVGGTNYNLSDTLNTNTTAANVGLGNVQNLNAQSQAQTGLIAGTTITGGGITLSGGGNIKGGQTDFNTGTGFFLGYSGTAYKFSIGNALSKGITWDGNTLAIGGEVTIGGTLADTIKSGAASGANALQPSEAAADVNANSTNISGNKIRTGLIQSNNHSGTADGSAFSTAGMSMDLVGGGISAKNFRITAAGAAFFKGDITGASGTFSGVLSGASGTFTGTITATSGFIGNWTISGGNLTNSSGRLILNPDTPSIILNDSNGSQKTIFRTGPLSTISTTQLFVPGGSTISIPQTSRNTPGPIFDTGKVYGTSINLGSITTANYEKLINFSSDTGVAITIDANTEAVASVIFGYGIFNSVGQEIQTVIFDQRTTSNYLENNSAVQVNWSGLITSVKSISFPANDTYSLKSFYSININYLEGSGTVTINALNITLPDINYEKINAFTEITEQGIQVVSSLSRYVRISTNQSTDVDALFVRGAFTVNGSKSFKITHPLDKTKWLFHSSIEGPRVDNLYRGMVKLLEGFAKINLDEISNMTEGTWIKLNRDPQFFLQNMNGWDRLRGEIIKNELFIYCENKTSEDLISYMVIGERHDDEIKQLQITDNTGRLITEISK